MTPPIYPYNPIWFYLRKGSRLRSLLLNWLLKSGEIGFDHEQGRHKKLRRQVTCKKGEKKEPGPRKREHVKPPPLAGSGHSGFMRFFLHAYIYFLNLKWMILKKKKLV